MQIHFTALLPHRDFRRLLRGFRRRLFAAGLWGAYSFPELAPFALAPRPWTRDELGAAARFLRAQCGVFQSGGGRFSTFPPGGPLLWGPELNLPPLPSPAGSIPLEAPVLCAALIPAGGGDAARAALDRAPPLPAFRFKAAALVNVRWESLGQGSGACSFSWRIGRPCWLPAPHTERRRAPHDER